jgi:hypothetical protein
MALTLDQIQRLDMQLDGLTPTHPIDLNDISLVSEIVRGVLGKPWLLDVHHRIRELVVEVREPGHPSPVLLYSATILVKGAPASTTHPQPMARKSVGSYAARHKR